MEKPLGKGSGHLGQCLTWPPPCSVSYRSPRPSVSSSPIQEHWTQCNKTAWAQMSLSMCQKLWRVWDVVLLATNTLVCQVHESWQGHAAPGPETRDTVAHGAQGMSPRPGRRRGHRLRGGRRLTEQQTHFCAEGNAASLLHGCSPGTSWKAESAAKAVRAPAHSRAGTPETHGQDLAVPPSPLKLDSPAELAVPPSERFLPPTLPSGRPVACSTPVSPPHGLHLLARL